MTTRISLAALLPLLLAATTYAQTTRPGAAAEWPTRSYEVHDLLVSVPEFDRDAAKPPRAPTPQELAERLIQWLRASTVGGAWDQPGVNVHEASGQLRVTAPPALQEQIASILDRVRDLRAAQVTVEARILSMDAHAVELLPAATRGKLTEVNFPLATRAVLLDDDADVDAMMMVTRNAPNSSLLTAPRVTLFDGQRAFVTVATSRAYCSGYRLAEDAPKDKPAVEPVVSVVENGIWLDARAVLSPGRKNIAVDLRLTSSQLLEMKSIPFAPPPELKGLKDKDGAEPRVVQQPVSDTVKLDQLLTMPSGKTMLLAFRAAPGEPANRGGADHNPPLTRVVLLKATALVSHEHDRAAPVQ